MKISQALVIVLSCMYMACTSAVDSISSPIPTQHLNSLRSSDTATSPKKGLGVWYFDGIENAIRDSGTAWYYTWQPDPQSQDIRPITDVEFVPMVRDRDDITSEAIDAAARNGDTLLTFNEPDLPSQADMSVDEVVDAWPKLQATGMRLGSPATAGDPSVSNGWFDRFMNAAQRENLKIDFVCVHWYGSNFETKEAVEELRQFLQRTHDKYKLPIWLTEFSLIRWEGGDMFPSDQQQQDFVTASVNMLESLPFLERYAWFSASKFSNKSSENTFLYKPGAVATDTGIAYRKAPTKQNGEHDDDSASDDKTETPIPLPAPTTANLLSNGGFEYDFRDWQVSGSAKVQENENAPEGTKLVSIRPQDTAEHSVHQTVRNLEQGSYEASVWSHATGSATLNAFAVYDFEWNLVSADWFVPIGTSVITTLPIAINNSTRQAGVHIIYFYSTSTNDAEVKIDKFLLKK